MLYKKYKSYLLIFMVTT